MKKRYREEQIIGFLKEAESGISVKELCRRHGFSEASFYAWRSKFGGMEVSERKRLAELKAEDTQVKRSLVDGCWATGLTLLRARRMLSLSIHRPMQ